MFEGRQLRKKLRAGEACLGTWINFTDPTAIELMAGSGFDFFIIDSEHSAMTVESVQLNIMATKGSDVAPLVRVPWNDQVHIKRVLDAGAAGVLVPLMRTVNDVESAVAACLYPPAGIRGFGPRRPTNYYRDWEEYVKTANDDLVIWVQIEHVDALKNVREIVKVPRLDGILIGPYDLSGSMGLLGQISHPKVLEAIKQTIAAGNEADVPVGIVASDDPQEVVDWLSKGLTFITVSGDQGFLLNAGQAAVSETRALLKGAKDTPR